MECHSGAPLHATTLTKMRIRSATRVFGILTTNAVTHHLHRAAVGYRLC
jgi:hypothetical protein